VVKLLRESGRLGPHDAVKTALEVFKEQIFLERMRESLAQLGEDGGASVEDWQTIHTLVTLMRRNDAAAKQWLSILIRELDEIMVQLAAGQAGAALAPGSPALRSQG
jgi:hypothetical protein